MDITTYNAYLSILHSELVPAMGCTEPIAIALTASHAAAALGEMPTSVSVLVSGNIIKNVKSVIVPNTNGQRGIRAAVAAGIIASAPERELEVLSALDEESHEKLAKFLENTEITVNEANSGKVLDIDITLSRGNHSVRARTVDSHTGLCLVEKDGEVIFSKEVEESSVSYDSSVLSVEGILEFAEHADLDDVREVLDRQIAYNTAIAEEGLTGKYGAAIGRTLLLSYGDTVYNRAKAWAAAGSDARMSGCDMPVVINSGSGNQGMTASLPVIAYAEYHEKSREELLRALTLSNLVTLHLKSGIGRLSAYCGAVSAGAGAGAGIAYLLTRDLRAINHTLVNALAISSGIVCDGAKASCAAKIAMAVDAGIMGFEMFSEGCQFYGGDGLVSKGVENTIRNISILGHDGMKETDRKIIEIMTGC